MLAATTKIGSKYLVHIEILKALGTELENLPEKEKVMFDFKSAVVFGQSSAADGCAESYHFR